MKFIKLLILSCLITSLCFAQETGLKSIEDVISGIDSLLEEIDRSSEDDLKNTENINNLLQDDYLYFPYS